MTTIAIGVLLCCLSASNVPAVVFSLLLPLPLSLLRIDYFILPLAIRVRYSLLLCCCCATPVLLKSSHFCIMLPPGTTPALLPGFPIFPSRSAKLQTVQTFLRFQVKPFPVLIQFFLAEIRNTELRRLIPLFQLTLNRASSYDSYVCILYVDPDPTRPQPTIKHPNP